MLREAFEENLLHSFHINFGKELLELRRLSLWHVCRHVLSEVIEQRLHRHGFEVTASLQRAVRLRIWEGVRALSRQTVAKANDSDHTRHCDCGGYTHGVPP